MLVRRFMQWLKVVLSSAHHVSSAAPAPERAITDVAPPPATSWLAASLRLRPSPHLTIATVSALRDRQVPPRLRSGAIGREQVAAGRSRPLDVPPGVQPPSRVDQAIQQQSASVAPHTEPLAPGQDAPSFDPASPFGDDAALHRQLAAFKQLVRLGVYNEGFQRDALPEQYTRNLRPDDDFAGGNDQN